MAGPNAGEMMMSVFWYYRPEQTEVGRVPNFHGEVTHSLGKKLGGRNGLVKGGLVEIETLVSGIWM